MNILFVGHESKMYGSSRSLFSIIQGLAKENNCYVLLPEEGPFSDQLKCLGVKCFFITYYWNVTFEKTRTPFFKSLYNELINFYLTVKIALQLLPKFKELNINVVYTNTSVIYIGWILSFFLKAKHVWHIREKGFEIGFNHIINGLFFKLFKKLSYRLIYNSNALQRLHQDLFNRNKSTVVYNGIFNEEIFDVHFNKYSIYPRNTEKITLLLIGTINENKGQKLAIKAVKELLHQINNIRLLIVGQGDIESLKDLIKEHKIGQKVEFWGHLTDPTLAYLEADILLMCSRFEPFGRVTVEAMSYGIPVIGYASGGTAEIIHHGKNGLLFKGGEKELAESIMILLSDKEMKKSISVEGWRYAKEHFTTEKYLENVKKALVQYS